MVGKCAAERRKFGITPPADGTGALHSTMAKVYFIPAAMCDGIPAVAARARPEWMFLCHYKVNYGPGSANSVGGWEYKAKK